jgi:hypothetical protein
MAPIASSELCNREENSQISRSGVHESYISREQLMASETLGFLTGYIFPNCMFQPSETKD